MLSGTAWLLSILSQLLSAATLAVVTWRIMKSQKLYKTTSFNYWNCQTGFIPISLILLSSSSNRFSIFKSLKEIKYFEWASKTMKQLPITLISVFTRFIYNNNKYNESSTHSSTFKAESPMHCLLYKITNAFTQSFTPILQAQNDFINICQYIL